MHELVFLKSLVTILAISAVVIFALGRVKVPSIVGFLLAGMLLGPYGLNFIEDAGTIQTLAEIGVILLLFTIGIEFSLSRFLKMRLEVFGIGGLYVFMTVVLTAIISYRLFENVNQAVFAGFLVALSSTAIVMKLLSERAEIDAPQGRAGVGILIFQDLCVVPFMLLIPIMSGGGGLADLAVTFIKALAIVAVILMSARWVIPAVLHQIVRARSRELFVISILILCFGIAFLTAEFGLSLALGAFLAGLAISESEYGHEATSAILPFRDSFNGLFFISVGMLMDTSFLVHHVFTVLAIVAAIMMLKSLSGFFSAYFLGRPVRISIQTGLNLAQIGEFSFVLAVAGLSAGLISNDLYQWFLSSSVITMLLTPFLMQAAPRLSRGLSSRSLLKKIERPTGLPESEEQPQKTGGHVIIIGFGLNGRNLARVLREGNIPYTILEMNADTVRDMKKQGEPICYGDATNSEVLHLLGVQTARVMVVVISDPSSTRNIVKTARSLNPGLHIIARTRYAAEVDDLLRLGASDVIPEEFETSVEIFSRVLTRYHIPRNEIFNFVDMIREDGYRALRQSRTAARKPLFEKYAVAPKITFELFTIQEGLPVLGKSIDELKLRTKTGATVVAIERKDQIHTSPDPKFRFQAGDILFLTGKREDINRALVYLTGGRS
ncbi:MAG: cation:proton antiporter [Nitrospiraceae bacterium]|nr:MAG: cation:proton antiporter [Nitrospiraceae bacterium]